jgi:hypothetical protein
LNPRSSIFNLGLVFFERTRFISQRKRCYCQNGFL